ncbi:unnamed protein product [Rangifer tarandus platyrhynchus]|uniref:Uncharacterized protein n=2 Tax=Rangifer tarandus platyrhynchus TaxID=3082113 RepID=A0ACB0ERN5_RANTA|nr:unnamed protein product [Rangifer tarandus platyrhynchus]CAI9703350.1 unnamed protein product [Rangifer tarandus platyrhynchus]
MGPPPLPSYPALLGHSLPRKPQNQVKWFIESCAQRSLRPSLGVCPGESGCLDACCALLPLPLRPSWEPGQRGLLCKASPELSLLAEGGLEAATFRLTDWNISMIRCNALGDTGHIAEV